MKLDARLHVKLFFLLGTANVEPKLSNIVKELKKQPIDATTFNEFKTYFKYLAFVISAAKAPVKQKMFYETVKRVGKAGEAENIQRWLWWTPTQLGLLEQSDQLPRVIIIGKES